MINELIYNTIVSTLLPLLLFLLIIISLNIILNKNIVYCIPLSFILTALLIMFGGYIGDLRIGLLVVLLLPVIAVVKVFVKHLLTKQNIISYLKKNGIIIVVFVIMFIFVCQYHSSSCFNEWDEFSHWGPMVKGMFYNNKLYSYLKIHAGHPEYPPLFQCIEWLFCYLSRAYSEVSVYRGLSTFSISLFFPVLLKIGGKDVIGQIKDSLIFLITVAFIITVEYVYMETFLTWAYLDFPIAVLAGVTGYLVIKNEKDSEWIIGIFLAAILLTKEIGIALYLVLIVLIITSNIIANKDRNYLKKTIFYILIPLVLFGSWKIYTSGLEAGQFALNRIDINELLGIIFNNSGTEFRVKTKALFISGLFNIRILQTPVVKAPFIQTAALLIVFYTVVLFFINKNWKKTISTITGILLGTLGYIFVMFVLYLYCFSEFESLRLASFDRYFGTFIQFLITVIMLTIVEHFINTNDRKMEVIWFAVIAVMLFVSNPGLLQQTNHSDDTTDTNEFRSFASQVEKHCNNDSNILIIDWNRRDHKARYFFYDRYEFGAHVIEGEYTKEDINALINSGSDYVYIFALNDPLTKAWNEAGNDSAEEGRLYKVVDGKAIKLDN